MVDLAIRISAMKDASVTMMATVHGNARLRKGLLARLSFAVITGTLPSFKSNVRQKGYTPAARGRKPTPASRAPATELHVNKEDWLRKQRARKLGAGAHLIPVELEV